jgi:DNA (cytosine-5)-methyltransferase 1
MRYGSVCSGIEAATVAWHPLGWQPSFFSEIEPAPRSVLAHHYPDVPCHGDFTTIGVSSYEPIDLLVGGTPCQSFSIAGLRDGLDDDRGNLALEFLRLAQRTRPKWLVWENVAGVLSSNGGRDFGSIIAGLVECGYGFAYRVLDAQYFGVAQRRRRIFVIGCFGDWRPAAAVLFERKSLQGGSAPSRKKGQEVAGTIAARFGRSRNNHEELTISKSLLARNGAGGFDLESQTAVIGEYLEKLSVRCLTPRECERLQGFPDDYTLVPHRNKPMSDGPRYKALGNSMAVPVMRWIGERIQMVEDITKGA